jgi:hypothetical protein
LPHHDKTDILDRAGVDARTASDQETEHMIRIRPLAGAVLMTLLLTPVAFAGSVEIIMPGGNTSLVPPSTGGVGVESLPRSGGSGKSAMDATTSYTPPEVDAQPSLQTMHFGGASLACKVASTANDLVLINQGLEPLPPGTRVKWQLKNEGKRGFFAIIGELGGGESLIADGVVDGGARTDDVCVARVI